MAKYRKKPVVIEASVWLANGDHSAVEPYQPEAHIRTVTCELCGVEKTDHGFVRTLEGGHIVCPGDWIITGVEGEHYPCKPGIFHKTYECIEGEAGSS